MILPVVLIFMVVGALLITPSLSFASTGLRSTLANRERVDQLYAAGAGVEDAIHKVKNNHLGIPGVVGDVFEYGLADVNGKGLQVEVECISTIPNDRTYLIISKAKGIGSSTLVKSYVSLLPDLFSYAAVCRYEDCIKIQPKADIVGSSVSGYKGFWPNAEMLRNFYLPQVTPPYPVSYPDDVLNVNLISEVGPLYREGDLTLLGDDVEAKLIGTIYVKSEEGKPQTGKLKLGGKFTLDLNGQAIFVESSPDGDSIDFGVDVTLKGSGVIVAIGDIKFLPKLDSSGDYIFIMSVEGKVVLQPKGDFYGTVAGNSEIRLQPDSSITWVPPPIGGVNFPMVPGDNRWMVKTWEISRG